MILAALLTLAAILAGGIAAVTGFGIGSLLTRCSRPGGVPSSSSGPLLLATAGVAAGTVLGTKVLIRLPRAAFRRAVACMLLLLGTYMLVANRG